MLELLVLKEAKTQLVLMDAFEYGAHMAVRLGSIDYVPCLAKRKILEILLLFLKIITVEM